MMKKSTFFLATAMVATMGVHATNYVLVTDLADVTTGKYVIVAEEGWDMAMTSEVTDKNIYLNKEVTINDKELATLDNTLVWDIVANNGVFTIQSAETEKYLGLKSDDNNAYACSALEGDKTNWTITVDSVTVISSIAYPERDLQYNTSSPRFACYKGTLKDLRLFKETKATEAAIYVSDLDMGSVATGSTTTGRLSISGELLTSDVTVSIASNEHFAAETVTYTAEMAMKGVEFPIEFTAPQSAGNYTAIVSVSSADFATTEVAVSVETIAPIAIANIFDMSAQKTIAIATATVDHVYKYASYISDSKGTSIRANGLTDVKVGDVLTNIVATTDTYYSIKQINNVSVGSVEAGESTIQPKVITLAELMASEPNDYGSQLVTVEGVTLAGTAFDGNNLAMTQDGTTSNIYNGLYIKVTEEFPTFADVTGYVTSYKNSMQVSPRTEADIVAAKGEAGMAQTATATTVVASAEGGIVVKATEAAIATIYNVAGTQVATVELVTGNNRVELEQGLYIVVVDGTVAKAVVR